MGHMEQMYQHGHHEHNVVSEPFLGNAINVSVVPMLQRRVTRKSVEAVESLVPKACESGLKVLAERQPKAANCRTS